MSEAVAPTVEQTAHAALNDPEQKSIEAMAIVKRNMLWSAGAGLLPVPGIELVAITAVELKLIRDLAHHYSIPFSHDAAKSAIISLVGSLGSLTFGKVLATSSLRLIPVIGSAIAFTSLSAVSAGVTYAIGKVFIAHFETGGTLLDFQPAKVREFFRQQYDKGLKEAASLAKRPAAEEAPVAAPAA